TPRMAALSLRDALPIYRRAGVRVAVRPAGDAAAVVAQIGDVEFEGGLVDAGQIGNPTSRPWFGSTCRSADHGSALRLFLLPVSAGVLVPPAGAGAFDPLLGEHAADLALPFRVAVGDGDLAVHGLAVAVVVGDGVVHHHPVLERQLARVAHDQHAVVGEAERAGAEAAAPGRVAARPHPRLDRLDRRGADVDVGLRLRVRAADAQQHPRVEAVGAGAARLRLHPGHAAVVIGRRGLLD